MAEETLLGTRCLESSYQVACKRGLRRNMKVGGEISGW